MIEMEKKWRYESPAMRRCMKSRYQINFWHRETEENNIVDSIRCIFLTKDPYFSFHTQGGIADSRMLKDLGLFNECSYFDPMPKEILKHQFEWDNFEALKELEDALYGIAYDRPFSRPAEKPQLTAADIEVVKRKVNHLYRECLQKLSPSVKLTDLWKTKEVKMDE